MSGETPETALAALRGEIDRIDAGIHELLIERSAIIDRLIATKRTAASGSAFRPDREAAMMRVLAGRHRGILPLAALEGIWRVIISTFTHVQAPFRVHGDTSAGRDAVRDSGRFHFGFSVPFETTDSPRATVDAVARSRGDLGLVGLGGDDPWWQALEPDDAPKIIARLPIAPRPDHPAPVPLLVVSPAPSGEGTNAVVVWSVRSRPDAIGRGEVLSLAGDAALVAVPRGEGPPAPDAVAVGSHPEPVRTNSGG